MKKSHSSKRWLKEHFSDVYVKRAHQEGYRARSVYKLLEIQTRYRIVRPKMIVVDLGAAPGGWSEYLRQLVGQDGKVVALDILPMRAINGVEFIQGDFNKPEIVEQLCASLGGRAVDVIVSDMAPNLSGNIIVDQARVMELAENALAFALKVLKSGGVLLIKIFQGEAVDVFLQTLHHNFKAVKVVKPDASRSRSREVFILAREKL